MGPEANILSITALERQIEDGKGDIIKLKRTRNSLLNISTRVPPEILGSIFAWVVTRKQNDALYSDTHFAGLEKGSYNFLLVCNYWFEVAASTPEVWIFWGKTLEDWSKQCSHSGGAPIDLVLDEYWGCSGTFESSLSDVLRDRATQDGIRQIHLACGRSTPIASIISSLTPDWEGPRERRVESIILLATNTIPAELSTFFARSHLTNLRCLRISGDLETQTPLWDCIPLLQTTCMYTLSLSIKRAPLPITTSQLTAILISNPNLRELQLSYAALPDDAPTQVSLRHLKKLFLEGEFRYVFGLLDRLELPATLDCTDIRIVDFTAEDVLQTLGSYMQERLQRDNRFRGKLSVVISLCNFADLDYAEENTYGSLKLTPLLEPSTEFSMSLLIPSQDPPDPALKELTLDLLALIPLEHVVSLKVEDHMEIPEDLFVAMPNIETLCLRNTIISNGFLLPDPTGPHANKSLLPSLKHLHMVNATTGDAGWEPFKAYMAHRASNGEPISIKESAYSYMPPEVAEEIRAWQKHLLQNNLDTRDGYRGENGDGDDE